MNRWVGGLEGFTFFFVDFTRHLAVGAFEEVDVGLAECVGSLFGGWVGGWVGWVG